MDKNVNRRRFLWQAWGIIFLCMVAGLLMLKTVRVLHQNTANKHWKGERYLARKNNPWNIKAVDSCIQLLQSGDLVVRRGDDMTSYMLSKLNHTDRRYSHCGIVVVEKGTPYVYHSIGGEDNPDQVIRKDKAKYWFSPANNLAFATYRYDMPDSVKVRMLNSAAAYYTAKKMFDMEFDLETDNRLYCSEMVYKAILTATGNKDYISTEHNYRRRFVGVDNLFLTPHAERVCQIKFK